MVSADKFQPTGTLKDVIPQLRPHFEKLIRVATELGMQPKVRSAGRTCEQQNEQLMLGYSKAGLCRSMHVIGHAIDLNLKPETCATYQKLGEIWEQMGGFWGGRWKDFGACGDAGHFHWPGNVQAVPTSLCPADVSLAQCRALREKYLSEAQNAMWGASLVQGLLVGGGIAIAWMLWSRYNS